MKNSTLSIQQLLSHFQSVKKRGNSYQAQCPAHDDRKASLSIRAGEENHLVFCHAGCETRRVLDAVGLKLSDLFTTGGNGNHNSIIVASYDYRDEKGTMLFQAVRKEPKAFTQRKPDGRGGWLWNLQGVRRVLYRLPELLKADAQATVFIVEGEKDADALATMGLVATTNPQGAGKWREEYNEPLAGREVVILPDNDKAGRDHAEMVARSLYRTAASVKLLPLPDLPEKGDVSDWLAKGGEAEALCVMAENAKCWLPELAAQIKPVTDDAPNLLQTWGNFSAVKRERGDEIVHRLERGELGMIAAVTNGGKSTLLRNIALTLACGGEFLPIVKRGVARRVYLLDFETSPARLQDDIEVMTRHFTEKERDLVRRNFALTCSLDYAAWINDEPLSLSNHQHFEFVRMNATAFKADLIIVDTVTAAFDISDENNNSEVARRILKPMVKLARETGAAVLLAHHIGKGSEENKTSEGAYRSRGASNFGGYSGVVMNLYKDQHDKNRRILSNPKAKGDEFDDVTLTLDFASRWFAVSQPVLASTPSSYDLVKQMLQQKTDWKRQEIEMALSEKMSLAQVKRCLKDGVANGEIEMPNRGIYRLAHGSLLKIAENSSNSN